MSKYFESKSDETSGIKGALELVIFFQSTPLKKGCFLISSAPFVPSRTSAVETNFLIKFSASRERFASAGILKCFFHCTIF